MAVVDDVIIGVDPHKLSATIEVADRRGVLVGAWVRAQRPALALVSSTLLFSLAHVTIGERSVAVGVLDMALLSKVPGMTIFAPSSYQELQVMLHDALDLCDGPAAIRWPRKAGWWTGSRQRTG